LQQWRISGGNLLSATANFYIMMLIFAGIGGAIWLSWWLILGRNHKPKEKTEESDKKEIPLSSIYARIHDNLDGQRSYNTDLPGETVKKIKEQFHNLGGQWNYKGKKVYEFCRTGDNDQFGYAANIYVPYELYLSIDRSNPPSTLHRYVNQPEISITRNVQKKQSIFEKYQALIWWSLGMAFIIFMIVSSRHN
jgi:hypothetical protein